MNKLSWILYFADVADSVSVFGEMFLVFSIASIIAIAFYSLNYNGGFGEVFLPATKWVKSKAYIFIAVLCLATTILIPSKETVYMMAASEMGEEVLKTEEMELLRKRITDYLGETQ